MMIRKAKTEDLPLLEEFDRHISSSELKNLIRLGRVAIAEENGQFAGWMRWNLFWDNTPFLNMLFIVDAFRNRGFGSEMMRFWEAEMKQLGFETLMTSTASDECAQHFYRKLGYRAIGGFTPFGDPYELIFVKQTGEESE